MQKYLLLTYTRAAQAQEVGLFHTMPANATHCRFILNEDTNVEKLLGFQQNLSSSIPKTLALPESAEATHLFKRAYGALVVFGQVEAT